MFRLVVCSALVCLLGMTVVRAQGEAHRPGRLALEESGLKLTRAAGSEFFDVVGRRSAVFGYENRSFEAWAYPLKLVDDLRWRFRLQGYPQEFTAADLVHQITVRPEATTLAYSHAAFTVNAHIIAPLDRPGIIILLDVDTVLPITIITSFRPALKLMWPAGMMTPFVGWNARQNAYLIGEETQRFAALIGSPLARETSLQPYQEEPRDLPNEFVIELTPEQARGRHVPIVIAGAVGQGQAEAERVYQDLLANSLRYWRENVEYYKTLLTSTLRVKTPDARLDAAFDWAKIGVDKGFAVNPFLGQGLIAGFRTSGASERPGFAWFFGRDAEWTTFALNSYGDFAKTRDALRLLKKYQRADGKIMHELSQSASFVDWFKAYPYAYASADSTPLYVVAVGDYYAASGDAAFVREVWDSVKQAYAFAAATDTDKDGLIENTNVGHGWVEGGALYPVHQEVYLAGLWAQASRALAVLAEAVQEPALQAQAEGQAARTRELLDRTFWRETARIYAFAVQDNRAAVEEATVMPTVPMWWRLLDEVRARTMLERVAAAEISTDWGTRLLSNRSLKYDPLSYHYGSVWPLFTGWASLGAYRYGRPHLGYAALKANAELTYQDALGYVTELLSGDFNQSFGRSSHHQVWSSAMVITPFVRGLLGLEADAPKHRLGLAPQLPADWDQVEVSNFRLGDELLDFKIRRGSGAMSVEVTRRGSDTPIDLDLSPAFPVDAEILKVAVDGRPARFTVKPLGDVNQVQIRATVAKHSLIDISYQPGTEVAAPFAVPEVGARTRGLKIISSTWRAGRLLLDVEGLAGQEYDLELISPRPLVKVENATPRTEGGRVKLRYAPRASTPSYVRQVITVELARPTRPQ